MAIVVKVIAKTRSFDDQTALIATFLATVGATDTVETCQTIKVAESPEEYWATVIIWTDNP